MMTLNEFIIEKQQDFPEASGELSSLLGSIVLASKVVNREINKISKASSNKKWIYLPMKFLKVH